LWAYPAMYRSSARANNAQVPQTNAGRNRLSFRWFGMFIGLARACVSIGVGIQKGPLRFKRLALAQSELVGVAETARASVCGVFVAGTHTAINNRSNGRPSMVDPLFAGNAAASDTPNRWRMVLRFSDQPEFGPLRHGEHGCVQPRRRQHLSPRPELLSSSIIFNQTTPVSIRRTSSVATERRRSIGNER